MNAGFADLFKQAFRSWREDKAPRLAAALAYFTLFSIAPLVLIAIAIAGMVFGKQAASGQIAQQISKTVSPQVAAVVQELVASLGQRSSMTAAYGFGGVMLLIGAAGVFGQLKDALNTVWGVERKPSAGVLGFVKDYLLSFSMVLTIGFLLLVSLVLSAGLHAFASRLNEWVPGLGYRAPLLDVLLSVGLFTLLFATIFKVLPDAEVAWKDVWHGALMTAVLFGIGKFLIGLYLGRSGVVSAYGAAGSLILLLLWVYYSAQIFLFGAEFTKVYARARGSGIVPEEDAVRTSAADRAEQGLSTDETEGRRAA